MNDGFVTLRNHICAEQSFEKDELRFTSVSKLHLCGEGGAMSLVTLDTSPLKRLEKQIEKDLETTQTQRGLIADTTLSLASHLKEARDQFPSRAVALAYQNAHRIEQRMDLRANPHVPLRAATRASLASPSAGTYPKHTNVWVTASVFGHPEPHFPVRT
jgi:hypothetical protein